MVHELAALMNDFLFNSNASQHHKIPIIKTFGFEKDPNFKFLKSDISFRHTEWRATDNKDNRYNNI